MKAELRYAEDSIAFDDAKLKLMDWPGKKAADLARPAEERRNRRERIKTLLARVKLVAEPVAAVLSTIASVAQLRK